VLERARREQVRLAAAELIELEAARRAGPSMVMSAARAK
jgi:hypothetical protein